MNSIQSSKQFDYLRPTVLAFVWLSETAFWAALTPFLIIGMTYYLMILAFGVTVLDMRDGFAYLGTSTQNGFMNSADLLTNFAITIGIMVVIYRVISIPVFIGSTRSLTIAEYASLLIFLSMILYLACSISIGRYSSKNAVLQQKPQLELQAARATIILPDGKTIVSGTAHVEADPDKKRYVVTFTN